MTSSSSTQGTRFQRANYVVSDLARALRFYCGVLGLRIEFSKDSPEDSYSYDVFEIDRQRPLGFAVLSTDTQPKVMALTEIRGDSLPPPALPRRAAIVLHVADVDAVVAQSAALGLRVYREERLETHDGRSGREVGIVDHDGNLVVIYTILESA